MPPRSFSVRFDRVSVRYPRAQSCAIEDLSFEVPAGSFTALLGPSGCGKSTLLRTVNRLAIPCAGSVYADGRDIALEDPIALRRNIGYVIQAVGLFPHMTVSQNVAVLPSLLRWPRERMRARVDELLELVGLDPARYRERYPRELSGGEAQRVGVARAVAAQPGVLLMDEPFGAVDAIVRAGLQEAIREIARTLQTTVLFVTHDVEEALYLADRIAVLRAGKLEQHDTPEDLLRAPASPYVERLFALDPRLRRYDGLRGTLR